jgi:hypothetical protein
VRRALAVDGLEQLAPHAGVVPQVPGVAREVVGRGDSEIEDVEGHLVQPRDADAQVAVVLVLEVLEDGLGLATPSRDQRRGIAVALRHDLRDRNGRVAVLPGPAQELLAGDADRVEAAGGGELVGPSLCGARERLRQRDRLTAGVGADSVDLGEELPAQLREAGGIRPPGALAKREPEGGRQEES